MLDTAMTTYTPTGWLMRNVVEGLVTSDINYNVKPMLADSWNVADDGLSITFTLRQDVTFHNGDTMDADDVVASMQRWTELSALGQSAIPGAVWEATDDNTVVVVLQERNSVLLQMLASGGANIAAIYPQEIVEEYGTDPIDDFVGTGPYTLEEYKPDEFVKLKRFADYSNRTEPADGLAGDRTPTYDEIEFLQVSDNQTRFGGALTGQYDITLASPEDYSKIQDAPELEPILNWVGSLYLNYNKKEGAMADVAVRQAVNTAIGSEEIMNAFEPSPDLYEMRPGIMLRSQEEQWNSDADADSYNVNDPELAKQMLTKTDYANEPVTIMAQQNDRSAKAAIVIQQQLEAAGFSIELKVVDATTLLKQREDPQEWDILVYGLNSKLEPSAMAFFSPDFAGWTNDPTITQLLKDYRGAATYDEARAMYPQIIEAYAEYRAMTKVADWTDVIAVKTGLESAPVHDSQIVFWSVPLLD
ncbi:ABC transporter substrate-binding protein [Microbacterium sp. MPKO10]|uniref:ABC transporter substrate-binding protein n=1 Tax=Microbacterium sp. MPKO10 TaxID=2989818 RepID=UPI0022362DAF|nr:ABC transporter substrate-binding protein [Microbacterium sp. MPKO10]MCW4459851.1 ABC transporter substrate-binding protein [Microbacterium sp. MPKO10]